MEKKQSSVEYFWNQIDEILPSSVDTETGIKLYRAFEQAKAMHKEEIVESWNSAGGGDAYHTGNQYYNETFEGNNE